MDEQKIQMLIDNEREWRKHLIKDLEEVKSDVKELREKQSTMRYKIFTLTAAIGAFAGKGAEYIYKLF